MFSNAKKEITEEELSNSSNIIGKGTSLEGDLNTAGSLRIEGNFRGSIQAKAKVVLADSSVVEGNIMAQNAEVSGKVQGTIKIAGLLTLKPTAVVNGDIITGKLVFEEGAQFDGKCTMGGPVKETSLRQPQNAADKKKERPLDPTLQQANLSQKGAKATA
ncbi:MAG: polymer-forming cytoskeletal protein [Bacteroidota bacterium]